MKTASPPTDSATAVVASTSWTDSLELLFDSYTYSICLFLTIPSTNVLVFKIKMPGYEDAVYLAKLAEQAERYEGKFEKPLHCLSYILVSNNTPASLRDG